MKQSVISACLVLLALFFPNQISAADSLAQTADSSTSAEIDWSSLSIDPGALDVGDSLIAPNSKLYFLKAIREYFEIQFADSDTTKAQKELEYSVRRLREVKSLIEAKREDLIEPTLEKYRNHLNTVENVFGTDINVGASVARHMFVQETLYHQISDLNARRMLRASMIRAFGYTKNLTYKIEDPRTKQELLQNILLRQIAACKFFGQEAKSGQLNLTEKAVLSEVAANCQKTIEEDFLPSVDQSQLEIKMFAK